MNGRPQLQQIDSVYLFFYHFYGYEKTHSVDISWLLNSYSYYATPKNLIFFKSLENHIDAICILYIITMHHYLLSTTISRYAKYSILSNPC